MRECKWVPIGDDILLFIFINTTTYYISVFIPNYINAEVGIYQLESDDIYDLFKSIKEFFKLNDKEISYIKKEYLKLI